MNLRDCPLVEIDDGLWECLQCGVKVHAKVRVKRNCDRAPGWKKAIRLYILSRLRDKERVGLTVVDEAMTDSRLSVCFKCDYFRGRTCTRWGGSCVACEKWLRKIIDGGCKFWT